ncbi:GNAT family N-acetyltransferase [Myxococcota bacterium]|nr:GNAT family N-acetyltransferase [Myxococcota bacterium]
MSPDAPTTSSLTPLDIRPFADGDLVELRELERKLVQAEGATPAMLRRARRFEEHEVLIARRDGRLVGTVAVTLKDARLHGHPVRAAHVFDLRVDPDHRGTGVSRELARAVVDLVGDRIPVLYATVLEGQAGMSELAALHGRVQEGAFLTLLAPTTLDLPTGATVRPASLAEVHASYLAVRPPCDLYFDQPVQGGIDGHAGSWLVEDDDEVAGCSVRDDQDGLRDAALHLPTGAALVSRLARWGRAAHLDLPRLPEPGQGLRSWTLFDVHATGPEIARSLLRHVLGEARAAGIDCCTVILEEGDPLLPTLREELPALFAPVLRHRLYLASRQAPGPPLRHLYVDVRDL